VTEIEALKAGRWAGDWVHHPKRPEYDTALWSISSPFWRVAAVTDQGDWRIKENGRCDWGRWYHAESIDAAKLAARTALEAAGWFFSEP
jgi:hypothetical protein